MSDSIDQHEADRLDITYFTDPLCCWSWGFEPQWRKLRYEFEGKISFRYCMAGLLPSWKDYNDAANSVSRPIQMGPVWMHASQLTGMPIKTRMWMEDPPASSYPACIAVKCATLQSEEAGEKYLRLVREAVMLKGENITKTTVLQKIAEQLTHQITFNVSQFLADLKNDRGLEAFRQDMQQVQLSGISRYPTLLLKYPKQKSIIITGYRPYPVLLDAITQVAPTLKKVQEASDANNYAAFWQSITEPEIKEAMGKL
ncbi:MAG: DsbA oxidoreductase [Segetibacter sp.]|nr:DsbA oxidoreductase [Segetibacter sp.]